MSALVAHAERELTLAYGNQELDEYELAIRDSILDIVKVFASQGHSGFSAPLTVRCLQKLLMFEPLTPLTGVDDEWCDVSDRGGELLWQNNRCSSVFKNADGDAYNINGRVFEGPDGSRFVNSDSRVPVTFPYTPKTEYVRVDADDKPVH